MSLAKRDRFVLLYERLSANERQEVELIADYHFCRAGPDDGSLYAFYLELEKHGWAQRSPMLADVPRRLWPNYWFITQQGRKFFFKRLVSAQRLQDLRNRERWALMEPGSVLLKFALLFTIGLAAVTCVVRWKCAAAVGCNDIKNSGIMIFSVGTFWFSFRLALPIWFRFGTRGKFHHRVSYCARVMLRWKELAILASIFGLLLHLVMVAYLKVSIRQTVFHDEAGALLSTALLFGLMVSLAWWGLPRLMARSSKDLFDPPPTLSKLLDKNSR